MKEFFKNFFLLTVPALIALIFILELTLRFLVPVSEIPAAHFDNKDLMYRFRPCQSGIYRIGKYGQQSGRWRINNFGWNSPYDYREEKNKIRIAVIGDSYVEAFQVDVEKSFPYLLGKKLGSEYEVYSFGISGAPLSQYLHIIRYVDKYFNPDMLIVNVCSNDFDESILEYNAGGTRFMTLSVSGQDVVENKPQANKNFAEFALWKRIINKSALARYVLFNLKLKQVYSELTDRKARKAYENNIDFALAGNRQVAINTAARYVIGKVRAENLARDIIFLFDGPRDKIYEGRLEDSKILWLHNMVRDICKENEILFLDMSVPMKNDYRIHRMAFNSKLDDHWNEYGHQFVADALYRFLSKAKDRR